MSKLTLTVLPQTYELLTQRAQATNREIDDLLQDLLTGALHSTDHPYIVRREGFRSGRPILRGSNIPVWLVAAMWKAGDTPEEIGQTYPHLEPAAIYDAISYYPDHQAEIEAEISENRIEQVLDDMQATMSNTGEIVFSKQNDRK
jgi:uncharacterized protein (DUF433 family)